MTSLRTRLAAGTAGTVMLLGGAIAAAAPASAAQAQPVKAANVLNCTTSTGADGHNATADCTNNTNQTVAFRVTAVCGWAPDAVGPWVTLNPGARNTSTAQCGGTGVGSASWEEG